MPQARKPEGLLARIATGEVAALGELYEQSAPALLGTALRILVQGDNEGSSDRRASREAAEEVVQETFLRLWDEAERMTPARLSIDVWLAIAGRRLAVDQVRARRKLPKLTSSGAEPLGVCAGWLPRGEEVAQLDARCALLRKVIRQLPKPQRRALELTVFGGHTEEEVAEQLGEPLARVKAGLRATMTFLRHRVRAVLGAWAANI